MVTFVSLACWFREEKRWDLGSSVCRVGVGHFPGCLVGAWCRILWCPVPWCKSGRRRWRPPQKYLSNLYSGYLRSISSILFVSICFLLFVVPSLLSLLHLFRNTRLPPQDLSTLRSIRGVRPLYIVCIRCGFPGRTWRFLFYVGCQQSGVGGEIRCWSLGARGYFWWSRSALRRPWHVAWIWCISPWRRGYSNVLSITSSRNLYWDLLCWSIIYCDRTVVGTHCWCPAFGGQRRAVTISGVACVDCHVWRWLRPISRFSGFFSEATNVGTNIVD